MTTPPAAIAAQAATGLGSLHRTLGVGVLLLGVVGALWGLAGVVRESTPRGLRAYLLLTEAVIGVQGVLGLALLTTGARPADGLHFVYGPALLLALPAAFALAVGTSGRRHAATLAGGALAVALLAVRALTTGGGG